MADPVTWETLIKAVEDLTTIIEEIDAKLLTHNQDPSSHGQEGEVVEEHRSDPFLDHALGSISLRHLLMNRYVIFTCFDSLDGWNLSGNASVNVFNVFLYPNSQINAVARIEAWDILFGSIVDYSKNPFFQTTLYFKEITSQLVYFGCGRFLTVMTRDSFGFKVDDGDLYAWWTKNGAANTQAIAGIDLQVRNVYRAEVRSEDEEIDFYINGVLKYTATVNFPVVGHYYPVFYYVKTKVAAIRGINIVDLLFEVER